jgi:hypothetical protein
MPSSSGPNTVNDSIVFTYDIGDVANSYRGEPTTNLVSDPDGNANVITTDVPVGTNVIGFARYGDGYYVNPRSTTNTSATGNTFTYSVYMRSQSSPASTYLMYVFTGTGPDGGWWYFGDGSLTSDWRRYTYTRSDMTGTVSTVTVYRYNQQGIIDIAAPQIEIKPIATQFTKGTRSSTQGLLDISGRGNAITLANMTYGANNAISFDGTDDRTVIGNLGTLGNFYSIECLFNSTSVQNYRNVYDMNYSTYNPNTGNVGPRLEQFSDGTFNWVWSGNTSSNSLYNATTPTSISANTFYHTVFTLGGGVVNTYKNGALINSNVSSPQGYITTFGDVNVGRGFILDPSRYFAGRVPVFKIYNRTLTATEVTNNYLAYKTRFNLS